MEGKGIVKGVSRMDGWNFFMKNAAHNLLMVRRWGNGTKKFYALQEKKRASRKVRMKSFDKSAAASAVTR